MQIAARTEGHYHVDAEEWQPAEGEYEDDHRNGLGRTLLLSHTDLLAFLRNKKYFIVL